jgi:hypothetical protein
MSFTRFHDDPCRIKKQLQESTNPGRWILNVPGNGDKPAYFDDPYIRMQGWGANLRTNTINLESDLLGLTKRVNKDCLGVDNYKKTAVETSKINYPTIGTITEQPRATNPAWTARDLEQVNWYILPLNPQENVCFPFQNNLSTRILEKDYYVGKAPCLGISNNQPLYTGSFTGPFNDLSKTCNATNNCSSGN